MRAGGTILTVTILLGLLAAVGLFAWAGLAEPGEPMPSEGYMALALGALAAVFSTETNLMHALGWIDRCE